MKKKLFTICISIFLAASSLAQIDNGTNYISDSKTKNIATKSQCDQIFKKNGDIISALIKDTLIDVVKYKICKDYITNATCMARWNSRKVFHSKKYLIAINYLE